MKRQQGFKKDQLPYKHNSFSFDDDQICPLNKLIMQK